MASTKGRAEDGVTPTTTPAKAGWGYQLDLIKLHNRYRVPIHQRRAYGPVQLDDTQTDYAGCVTPSNNTAEMSAVPQIMADLLIWRKRMEWSNQVDPEDIITVLMVYDSWYTMHRCNASIAKPTQYRGIGRG